MENLTLEQAVQNYQNDFELGFFLRSNSDRFKSPHLNLALEIYPNDEDLGFFIRTLRYEDSVC